jgi:hypothetical protein
MHQTMARFRVTITLLHKFHERERGEREEGRERRGEREKRGREKRGEHIPTTAAGSIFPVYPFVNWKLVTTIWFLYLKE